MNAPSSAAYLVYADRQRPRSQQVEPGVSDIMGCRRLFAYKDSRTAPTDPPSASMPAIIGTAVHSAVEEAVRSTGRPVLLEHEVDVNGIKGHLDRFEDGTVVDVKTVASYKFRDIKMHGASQRHLVQINSYGHGMIEQGYEVNSVRLDYICRDDGKEIDILSPYSEMHYQAGQEWVQQVRDMGLDYAPRDYAPDSIYCQSCPFRSACWGGQLPAREPERALLAEPGHRETAELLFTVQKQRIELEAQEKRLKAELAPLNPEDGSPVDVGATSWYLRWTRSGKGWTVKQTPKE